jgi:regulator of sigma E protease
MTTLLAFAVAIAVLVVFHELGHYLVARACDVKVLRFSVGFGKVLYTWHFVKGETEWAVSAVPLGGYVKMLDEREGEVAAHELPRAFNRKPPLQRMAIVVAGPVANLLLAVVLYWALFMHGIPGLKPVLGEIPPQTPAAAAQLQEQETIISIEGEAVPNWQELRWELLNLALQRGQVKITGRGMDGVLRQHVLDMSRIVPADLDGDFMRKLGLQPYQPPVAPVIDRVIEDSVAQRAGLQAGDTVLRIDGHAVSRWDELVEAVRSHPGHMLSLDIKRASGRVTIRITPDTVDEGGKKIGRIGAAPRIDRKMFDAMLTTVSYPPFRALSEASRRTWETASLSLKMIARMVTGQISLKNLSGPITIADYAGQSAQVGLGAYLSFLAFISISLGVLNLLPIPLLDGGHLLYYTVEFFKGGPVSERAWEIGQKIGISLLVTLMTFALYNDISRLILGHQ